MRVVVTGASGNVGTAVLRRLFDIPHAEIVGIARRVPPLRAGVPYRGVEWHRVDVGVPAARRRLTEIFDGADAVVHLAWAIQPSHRAELRSRTNLLGSQNVVAAAYDAGVRQLVHASSVGTYATGPGPGTPVTEAWPATGVPTSGYSRQKAAVEAMLDELEKRRRAPAVARLRPALTFQREAGAQIARYFLGPFAPLRLLRFARVPVVPLPANMHVQFVHADDVAEAYVQVLLQGACGAFNIAADPVLTAADLARHLGGVLVPTPPALLRFAAQLTWRARLQPTGPGWIDMATAVPVMDSTRAREELGWRPRADAVSSLREILAGLAEGCGTGSPVLRPKDPASRRLAAPAWQSSRP